jgi:septal ring factor EnvC (AmiA/AmiB activator)
MAAAADTSTDCRLRRGTARAARGIAAGAALLLGGFVLAALLLAAPAAAQESREAELERLQGEIARLQSRLSGVQQRERTLASELEGTRLQLELQERRVAEAQAARALAGQRMATLEAEVASLERRLVTVRGDLRGRLAALYRLGRAGYMRLLLALAPGQEVLPAIRQLRYLARRDGELVERFQDTRARLGFEREELHEQRGRLEGWVRQEELRRAELDRLRGRQAALLARVEGERRALETRSDALAEQAQKLSNLLAFLYGRSPNPAGTPIQGFRGVLDWPVAGRVSIPFGPRLDPRYRTKVPHNGITLQTRAGAEVEAVFPGKVAFAAPFQGFGQTVIVQHAGRAFTLYAGLAQPRVGQGAVLSLGQLLGVAGETLYFEIRIENRPQDPLLWLRSAPR